MGNLFPEFLCFGVQSFHTPRESKFRSGSRGVGRASFDRTP